MVAWWFSKQLGIAEQEDFDVLENPLAAVFFDVISTERTHQAAQLTSLQQVIPAVRIPVNVLLVDADFSSCGNVVGDSRGIGRFGTLYYRWRNGCFCWRRLILWNRNCCLLCRCTGNRCQSGNGYSLLGTVYIVGTLLL